MRVERGTCFIRESKNTWGGCLIFEFVKMKDGAYQNEHFNRFAVVYSSQ